MRLNISQCFLLLSVVFFFDSAISKEFHRSMDDTLAVVGTRVISVEKFSKNYKSKLVKFGFTDNVDSRRGFLENLITDELFIAQAKREKLNITTVAKKEFLFIQQQELLNEYTRKHILKSVTVTDSDLKEFYIKLNTKIKVRHLYAPTKEKAELLSAELQKGKTFEELAKNVFTDPILRDNGGLIGFIEVDEMDAEFEKAAFGLKIGEVSKPIKTVQGYSIIQVDDTQRNPFVTEYEYARSKERLRAFVRKRKYEDAAKNYSENLKSDLKIKINDAILTRLFVLTQKPSWQDMIEQRNKMFSDHELSKTIVTTKDGNWSIRKLIGVLSETEERQRKWIYTKENFKDYVTGLVLRTYITDQARKENLDTSESFRTSVEYTFDTYLSGVLENMLKKKIAISEDSMKAYYRQNRDRFSNEPKIRLSSILLSDKNTSDSVQQMLQDRKSFDLLANQYSVQAITAERDGDIGFFREDELGIFGKEIFSLQKGDWKGPLIDDGKYLFVQCTDYTGVTYKSYEETKEEIRTILLNQIWYATRRQYVEHYKKLIYCRVYPELLTSMIISLNNN